jgi:hypothetical protein
LILTVGVLPMVSRMLEYNRPIISSPLCIGLFYWLYLTSTNWLVIICSGQLVR